MKRILCICLLFIVITAGCNIKKENEIDQKDIQYIDKDYSMTDNIYIGSNTGLSLYDLENNVKVYACNLIGCIHQPYDKCLAYPNEKENEGFYIYPILYKNKLYYFMDNYDEIIFVKSNIDGTDKQNLLKFKLSTIAGSNMIRVGKDVYFAGKYIEEEFTKEGYLDIKSVSTELYKIDLNAEKSEQLTRNGKKNGTDITAMYYSEDKLYYQYYIQTKKWEDTEYKDPAKRLDASLTLDAKEYMDMLGVKYSLDAFDMKTKEIITYPFEDNFFLKGVSGDSLLINEGNEYLKLYDKDMKERKTLFKFDINDSKMGFMVYPLGDDLILDKWDNYNEPHQYYRWDSKQKDFVDLNIQENYSLSIKSSSNNKLLIVLAPLKGASSSNEWKYIMADKKDFMKGTITFQQVEENLNE